ncbi:MAG: helix-turn-helix transcriptional regulator [Bacteroidales bacterium]|nr:helix-turn-helix transcriptional regulator [Bacteroidales bacterium]
MEECLQEIGENLRNKECPDLYRYMLRIQDALDVLSGKWKIPILFAILKGHGRFSDIIHFCPGLKDKILDNRLKNLSDNKIIQKQGNEHVL